MLSRHCPHCGQGIGVGRFLAAVTGGRVRLVCPHCKQLIPSRSVVDYRPVLFRIRVGVPADPDHTGSRKKVAGRSLDRIPQIIGVGSEGAVSIGLGVVGGFVLLYYVVGALIFLRLEFDS